MDEVPPKTSALRFTKRRVALLTAAVFLAAVIGLVVVNHDSTPMPVYQGKTAREWLNDAYKPGSSDVMIAFEQMDSNAVPFLAHELARKDSASERFSTWLLPKLPPFMRDHFRTPLVQTERRDNAAFGLRCANSRTAIPAVTNLLTDGDTQQQMLALMVLDNLLRPEDTNVIPLLTNCLHSEDFAVILDASDLLVQINSGKLAIPALTNFVTSTDSNTRLLSLLNLINADRSNSAKWKERLTNDPDWKTWQK
jgi:hypothetical protein